MEKIRINPGDIANASDQNEQAVFDSNMDTFLTVTDTKAMGFYAGMVCHDLVDLERMIITLEFYLSDNPPNEATNPDRVQGYKQKYIARRKLVMKQLGDQFDAIYKQVKDEYNECERSNLNSSDGRLFCYVLPEFHEDGTHELWGEKDVPWNTDNSR